MLHYLNVEYNEKLYVLGDAPDFNPQEWATVKFTLGMEFPNLPYYVDGDYKLSETVAIMKYIAAKHDDKLRGRTP